MSRLTRRLLFAVTSVLALLALPGTAFARPVPIMPDTSGAAPTPATTDRIVTTSLSLWQASVVAVAAAVVAVLAVVILTRLARKQSRHTSRSQWSQA